MRICSYNVLAQCLAHSSYFPYSGSCLKWANRWPKIQSVLQSIGADIYALTEVDEVESYKNFFNSMGFDTVYRTRTNRRYGHLIAFKQDKFKLLEAAVVDLNDIEQASLLENVPTWVPNEIQISSFKKDCICLLAAFVRKDAPAPVPFVVSSSHFYFDKAAAVLKACQAVTYKLGVSLFASQIQRRYNIDSCDIIVTGDFNSTPNSETYLLMCERSLPLHQLDREMDGWNALDENRAAQAWLIFLRKQLDHEISNMNTLACSTERISGSLSSAYGDACIQLSQCFNQERSKTGKSRAIYEPDYTTFTETFRSCIDYIFYRPSSTLKLLSVDPLPNETQIRGTNLEYVAAPSPLHPSDHFPLVAEFS
jgi:mRNA deadenylase 3'-5' endonuclease subunit Ccr4